MILNLISRNIKPFNLNQKNKLAKFALIGAIVLLAAYLRLHNLSQLFVFTIDEEYLLNIAQSIVDNFHVIWIGMTNSSGISLGPLWIYFTSLFLLIGRSDPLVLAYVSVAIGVLTTLVVFIAGKMMFNFRVGLIASLLYATLPLIVFYDQRSWNNTVTPLMSISLLLMLFLTKRSAKWWIGVTFFFGLMFHTQITVFPYFFIAAFLFIKKIRRISKRVIFISVLVFFIMYSPLIAFDYFHKGSNIKSLLRFNNNKESVITLQQRLPDHLLAFTETIARIWYLTPGAVNVDENNWGCTSISKNGVSKSVDLTSTRTHPLPIVSAISLLLIIWFLLKPSTWKSSNYRLLAVSIISLSASFLILPIPPLEYYLLPIFPLLVLLPAIIVGQLKGKWRLLSLSSVIIVVILGINTVLQSKADLGIGNQKKIIEQVMKTIGNQPFALSEEGGCRKYAGWRYLFKAYGNTPVKSSIDSTFGWMYPDELSNTKPVYNIVVTENRAWRLDNVEGVTRVSAGGFEGYVTKVDTNN